MKQPRINAAYQIRILKRARRLYLDRISDMEDKIRGRVLFPFEVRDNGKDFFLIHSPSSSSAPLKECLEILNKKGELSLNDFLPHTF